MTRRSQPCARGRSSTRAETRPSRSTSSSSRAPSAARPFPPARRPGSSRRSSSATAATRWLGKGVSRAVANVRRRDRAAARAASTPPTSAAVDAALIELDGTPNKCRLGANAILGCSLAAAKAAAADAGVPLYRWVGGDERARPARADAERRSTAARTRRTRSTCRSSWSCPAGAETFSEALRDRRPRSSTRCEALLHERGLATAVGDEGGFAPDLPSTEAAIEAILEAAERAGHRDRIAIALDPAATELCATARYALEGEGGRSRQTSWSTSGPTWSTATRSSRSRTGSPRTSGTPGAR